MMNLAEYRKRPALLADYLPWAALVGPGAVLNKDASLQRTAFIRGPDLDSSTEGELGVVAARLNNALKRLGSGWAIFVEAQRSPASHYPNRNSPRRCPGSSMKSGARRLKRSRLTSRARTI